MTSSGSAGPSHPSDSSASMVHTSNRPSYAATGTTCRDERKVSCAHGSPQAAYEQTSALPCPQLMCDVQLAHHSHVLNLAHTAHGFGHCMYAGLGSAKKQLNESSST